MLTRPDILVLGGGGVLGRAWITGIVAGIEEASGFDLRRCEHFIGTSAGSIVAAYLASGHRPEGPPRTGTELEPFTGDPANPGRLSPGALARRAGAWALAGTSPLAPVALGLSQPAGRLVRAAMLRRVRTSEGRHDRVRREIDAIGARFDGRLRIVAVDRRSGRRVVFGRPSAPAATVGEAVEASCAVPWLVAPVLIGGREYVDGGVWSATNLDVAPAGRGTHVLCLSPLATAAGVGGSRAMARRAMRSAMTVEALALRRRGADVRTVVPDLPSVDAMGPNLMDPGPRPQVLAAGYRQGLVIARAATVR
jgi:NTE family protein